MFCSSFSHFQPTTRWLSNRCELLERCYSCNYLPQYNCYNLPQTQCLQLNARGRYQILFFYLTCTWHDPLYYIVDIFQVPFTKPKKWSPDMKMFRHTQNSLRWFKSNFFPHLINVVFLAPDVWTACLLVDFQPTTVDGISIWKLCFRKQHSRRLFSNLPLYTTSPVLP